MRSELVIALRMVVVTLVLTGVIYPLAIVAFAQLLFPRQADGSMVAVGGRVVGSELLGQAFASPGYFHGRPSAAGPGGYDSRASGGSNLGPTSARLRDRVAAEAARLRRDNASAPGPVPGELVAASASGLDPHLSPAAALWQAPRVAAARGVPLAAVQAAVAAHVDGRSLGILGEPRVNVLLLNLDLDRRFGRPSAALPST